MSRAVLVAVLLAAILAGHSGATGSAVAETRSCTPASAFFNVHFAGHKGAGYWLGVQHETFAPVPAGKPLVAVWSFGSQATRKPVLYAWSVDTASRIRAGCRILESVRAPTSGNLRAPFRVQKGWSIGKRYECGRGRVAIRTQRLASAIRTTVWYERTRRLIAVAEIGRRGGWIRASKACAERSY